MKLFTSIIALVAFTYAASAQFVAGPRARSAVTTSGVLGIYGSEGNTNLATGGIVRNFELTKGGNVSFYAKLGSTNATTDRITFTFQVSPNGTQWFTPQGTYGGSAQHTLVLAGTTGVQTYTNAWVSDALNNLRYIRLQQISNGHDATLFCTNLTFYQAD